MASEKATRLTAAEPTPSIIATDEDGRTRFLHSVLCQVSLPRSQVAEQIFTRRSGQCFITLQAGAFFNGIKMVPQPLPFGTKPRLVLIHACSEAVRTRSRQIEVGHSVRGFLRTLGIDCGGKEMAAFRKQMLALASTHMVLGVPSENGPLTIKAPPVETFNAWLANEDGQTTAWPGTLELGERFFDTLLEHAVPLSPPAVASLKSSSLALDIYSWLAHRLCRIRQPGGVMLSWANLHEQFGQEYADVKGFKKRFLGALAEVHAVYREAKLSQVRGGIRIYSSPPPIARKSVVVALPPSDVSKASKVPLPKPAAVRPQLVSEDALDKVRGVAPGWDRQYLAARYREWMSGKEFPSNPDAAFLGWCKKFTKGKRP